MLTTIVIVSSILCAFALWKEFSPRWHDRRKRIRYGR